MKSLLRLGCNRAGCLPRLGDSPAGRSVDVVSTPSRSNKLACYASVTSPRLPCRRAPAHRGGRRHAVVCNAAAKNFYEILGVSQSASERDIKSAYRKLAMKLHPDVNKAPDAQQRFVEVKVAYETLSDAKQRAEYDRRLRMGGFNTYGARTGAGSSSSSSGFGGAPGSGGWGSYGTGPNYTQEPVPGLDELVRELEKEFTAWANSRGKGGKGKTLMEELEDLGGELLDFLEESLGIKDEQPAAGPSGSASNTSQQWSNRSAAERFDDIWKQYGDGTPPGSTATSGANSGSTGSSNGAGTRAGTSSSTANSTSGSRPSSANASTSSSTGARPDAGRTKEDDIEAELQALKKKLNKI